MQRHVLCDFLSNGRNTDWNVINPSGGGSWWRGCEIPVETEGYSWRKWGTYWKENGIEEHTLQV